ncbi:MAG: redoxin domain-containing protein [Rubrobacteraceae bacterium]|nr:redoxin domain-containing protein [Rubrobacteraceae bacterium]MDQ3437632.1 peroxiredoxin family protein [Actinomycetota bacterium]
MKRLAIVFIVVLAAALFYRSFGSAETGTGSLTLPQPAPNVGDRAPGFGVESVAGRNFELSDKGVYVLTFWSTLNKSSNQAAPGFEDLARRYENDGASFAVVYVNSAPSDDNVPYTMLLDSTGELVSKYNVKRVPRLFVIEDGTIEYAQDYYYEGYEKNLREAIDEALSKEPEQGRQSALREQ